jgi:rhamnosyltransferase
MTRPAVSVVIPTLNAGPLLDGVLDGVLAQDGDIACEIIGIDSGSTDGTLARLRRRGARVVEVPAGRFNHGESRNAGLALAAGELAVLLVQDAVPASTRWLQALIEPLLADERVAGSFARQWPAPRASRLTMHYLSRWVAAQPAPRVVGPLSREDWARMPPSERHAACAFDNVCACVRLNVWRLHPFRRTPIAEDLEWAREVLLAGHKLAYAPAAGVRHSHERPILYELQRTYLVHQRLHSLLGLETIPTIVALLRAIGTTVPAHIQLAASEDRARVRAMLRGAALGVAWPLGQYLGARSSRDGRTWLRTGRI